MKTTALLCALALISAHRADCAEAPSGAKVPPRLRVSEDGRYLITTEGRPFFYLADTAWELFHRLNREEAVHYLADRAAKGFTVIQCVALAELDGLRAPNAYGHRPLIEDDPARPDVQDGPANDYWDHVDFVVSAAAARGLFIGLLPTWGDKWQTTRGGAGPVIFNPENARTYGRWLGERYRAQPILWILGGDRNVETASERAIIDAMAHGLRDGDGGSHLITFHPRGPGASSDQLHKADWLDFNMVQSSHGARDHDNGLFIAHDRALTPSKPSLDGEPRYEHLTVGFYLAGASRHLSFDDYDCRQAAYWALLAGACGHTYGNGNIWQMWAPGRTAVLDARIAWHEALNHPGAFQMGYARRLFESRPFTNLVPDESFIVDAPRQGGSKVRGAVAKDGAFAFVYSPRGEAFTLRLNAIKAPHIQTWWFDPRYGSATRLYTADGVTLQTFVPPSSGRGQDWLLVLDDARRNFPAPGQVK